MQNNQKKILKSFLIILAIIVLVMGVLGVWLNSGSFTKTKIWVFKVVPYPMALVNNRPVLMRDYIERLEIATRVNGGAPIDSLAKTSIYNTIILEEEIRQVASSKNASVSPKELEQAYQQRIKEPGFLDSLQSFGLSESEFKNKILKGELLLIDLQVWFNSQKDLNSKAYFLADDLLGKISQGQNMGDLAKTYSQDESSKSLGGDLGFVDPVNLLGELREPTEILNTGETKIFPSRLGLHIISQEGAIGAQKHLRQIFIRTENFEDWLNSQIKNFKVKKLTDTNLLTK